MRRGCYPLQEFPRTGPLTADHPIIEIDAGRHDADRGFKVWLRIYEGFVGTTISRATGRMARSAGQRCYSTKTYSVFEPAKPITTDLKSRSYGDGSRVPKGVMRRDKIAHSTLILEASNAAGNLQPSKVPITHNTTPSTLGAPKDAISRGRRRLTLILSCPPRQVGLSEAPGAMENPAPCAGTATYFPNSNFFERCAK